MELLQKRKWDRARAQALSRLPGMEEDKDLQKSCEDLRKLTTTLDFLFGKKGNPEEVWGKREN